MKTSWSQSIRSAEIVFCILFVYPLCKQEIPWASCTLDLPTKVGSRKTHLTWAYPFQAALKISICTTSQQGKN